MLKSMQLLTDCEVDLVCVEDAIDSSTQGGRLPDGEKKWLTVFLPLTGNFLVDRNRYAKTFKFEYINYAVASCADREARNYFACISQERKYRSRSPYHNRTATARSYINHI